MLTAAPPSASVTRRALLSGAAGVAGLAAAGLPPIRLVHAQDQGPVSVFDTLIDKAARLAGEAYQPPPVTVPKTLMDLDYDDFRKIRFRRDQALWRGEVPFELQMLHLGGYLRSPVSVFSTENGAITPLTYRPGLFDFSDSRIDPAGFGDIGFSGVRVHYPLNRHDVMDDLVVFQGASYFRALCAGSVYGLSARGIAVNTAHHDGEEFPAFTELYVERPDPLARSIVLHALLDGPSVTGAYRFEITPGATTRTTVQARLFARQPVPQLGMGVLTSMFDFAPIDRAGVDDFRPRVHDSQGLSIQTATGEWLWRPLTNPDRLAVNTFSLQGPKGFGLMQRMRAFPEYQDLEARYHLRPSAWVTPRGDWGAGEVVLVEIPTPDETNDNIVAFWKPAQPFEPGQPLSLDYDIDWTLDDPDHALAWCHTTLAGRFGVVGVPVSESERRLGRKWVIDFVGGPLCNLRDAGVVEVVASVGGGRIEPPVHTLNDLSGGVRVYLDSVAEGDGPMNLRCHLARGGTPVSETWTVQWRADTAA
ncbi:glucan biosynthesis protein [Roseospira visakhapatnamensis]|uniref:Glucans biosynthesis protein G n=1 Tax=Roseospira visakhapatnamensis TaxID=390880 RepID=A0A7W6RDH7_9PROT|nr:glucan biosynthesis protein G [Roseospira visakhapatnamensis]MBB4266325.1 glucans biosynthesis protein [Roseospira visakhapatnamensis]